jgi:hypothetical protein
VRTRRFQTLFSALSSVARRVLHTLNPTQQLSTFSGVLDSPIDKQTVINTLNIQGWILVDTPDQPPNIEIRLDEMPIHTRIERVPRPDVAAQPILIWQKSTLPLDL